VATSERTEKSSSESHVSKDAKAEGAFVAFAAGDALGWPQEVPTKTVGEKRLHPQIGFRRWIRRGGSRFNAYEESIAPGEYSDDTQLMLAVARSRRLPAKEWWREFTHVELPLWTLYARGGGGATKRAAASWLRGRAPWKAEKTDERRAYFDAGGNGAAMRVLPHALYHASDSEASRLLHDVALDAVATHGHPRAIVGALVYAYAAWLLLRTQDTLRFGELVHAVLEGRQYWTEPPGSEHGTDWSAAADTAQGGSSKEVWKKVITEMVDLLEIVRGGLRDGALADDAQLLKRLGCFGEAKGAGTVTAAAALYFSTRYAAQPTQAVLASAFARGADTDTLAAMSGGLVGCLSGIEWLPPDWGAVQDGNYLRTLARSVNTFSVSPTPPSDRRSMTARELDDIESLLWRGGAVRSFGALGPATAVSPIDLKTLTRSSTARQVRVTTEAGQTLYVTKVSRVGDRPHTTQRTEDLFVGRNDAYVFAQRTLANLDHVLETARANRDLHPVTQLANSLLGLVVFPYERAIVKKLEERELASLDGWPKWDLKVDDSEPSKKTKTLGRLLWHLRNAAAHGRLRFSSDSTDLQDVRLIVEDKPNQPDATVNWRAEISAAQLEGFCRRLVQLIEAELG
jgi:ADP-ribosylglycohydrolase